MYSSNTQGTGVILSIVKYTCLTLHLMFNVSGTNKPKFKFGLYRCSLRLVLVISCAV